MNDEFRQKHQTDLDKPVTMGVLLEYTDQFLLPKFEEVLLPKFKAQTKGMFSEYTDESLMPKIKEQTKATLVEYTDEVLMPQIKEQTKGMLVEYTDEVLMPKIKEQTMGMLLEYTDEFLLPRFSDIIDDKIKDASAKQTYEIKSYFSDQLADRTSDIFKRFDKKWEKDKEFRQKVVELFKRHNIGSATDIAYLEGLVFST